MARQKQLRKIPGPPRFSGFRPYGYARGSNKGSVELFFEEYEALKLTDYDLLDHRESAATMGVSRATFARIYESARRKIAKAFVESKEIKTVYGNVYFDSEWFLCNDCYMRFKLREEKIENNCPVCRSANINSINVLKNESD